MGRRIMPTASSKAWRETKFYTCPLGPALDPETWVASALELFRHSGRGERLLDLLEAPTSGAWQLVEFIRREVADVDALAALIQQERERVKAKAGQGRR